MNVWNKVFLGIIIVTAIAVVVLASVEMKIRSTGLTFVDKLEKSIEEKAASITKIITGRDPKNPSAVNPSLEEIRGQNILRFDERGRVWFGCRVRSASEITLPPALTQVEAQVILTSPFVPNETGIETDVVVPENLKGIVYVFEVFESSDETGVFTVQEPGTFLGRFRVETLPSPTKFPDDEGNEKNGFQVTLITADPISDQEIDRILDAIKSQWALYLTPPVDRGKGIFDQLTEEEKQIFPEELLEQFQARTMPELTEEETEGQSSEVIEMWNTIRAAMDDPESESGRNFSMALDWLYLQLNSLRRTIEIVESDIETYKAADEKAKIENEKLENDCLLEEKRVEAMNVQREHVKALKEQYDAEVNKMALQSEKLQTLIATYAAKIAEYQLKVVEKIERQGQAASSKQP